MRDFDITLPACQRILSAACLVFLLLTPNAFAIEYTEITADRLEASNTIQPLDVQAFGDNITHQTGRLNFSQEDILLEGNGPEIRVSRTFKPTFRPTGSSAQVIDWATTSNAADWEVEIPRLTVRLPLEDYPYGPLPSGVQPNWRARWDVVATDPKSRCSNFSQIPSLQATSATTGTRVIPAADWWTGVSLIVPGQPVQQLLQRSAENVRAPTMTINGTARTFNIVTAENWAITCTPLKNGEPGEGFLAVSPDGTKYWFDWMTFSKFDWLSVWSDVTNIQFRSSEASLFVTRVEDVYGNYVSYSYTGDKLSSIRSSDGRAVDFAWISHEWDGTSALFPGLDPGPFSYLDKITVQPGSAEAKVWQYVYALEAGSTYWRKDGHLRKVIRPDGSAWTFDLDALVKGCFRSQSANILYDCSNGPVRRNVSITAPSGAVATFSAEPRTRMRYWASPPSIVERRYDYEWLYTFALLEKTINNFGDISRWTYTYTPPYVTGTNQAPATVSVAVTNPDTSVIVYTVNNTWRHALEGRLQNVKHYADAAQTQLLREVSYEYAGASDGPYPAKLGYSFIAHSGIESVESYLPLKTTITRQQGRTFNWMVNTFDVQARPVRVTRSSSSP